MGIISKAINKIGKRITRIDLVRVIRKSNIRTNNKIKQAYNINSIDIAGVSVPFTDGKFNKKSLAFQAFQRTNKRMAKSGATPGLGIKGASRKEVATKELVKANRRYTTLQLRLLQSQKNGIKQAKMLQDVVVVGSLSATAAADFTRYTRRQKNTVTVAGKQLYDKSGRVGKVRDGYKMVYGKLRRVRA